jgi:hypothetical protein
MADRRGTGGRGSTGQLPEQFSAEDFAAVEEAQELSRGRSTPSKLQPLIDMARQSPGRKFERQDVVMDGDKPQTDESGNVVRRPHVYSLSEAESFASDLRNAGNRNKLSAKNLSLRIVSSPPLTKAKEQGANEVRVQFYIVGKTPDAS